MDNQDIITAQMQRCEKDPNTIYISPAHSEDIQRLSLTFNEVRGATERLLINIYGFSKTSFTLQETPLTDSDLYVKVKFIDEGPVMAKLQGLLV